MQIEPTMDRLRQLRFSGMLAALEEQLQQPSLFADLSFEERVALLVEKEWTWREDKKLKRRLTAARLKDRAACVEDIDYRHPRGLERNVVRSLITSDWLRRHQNLIISGATGSGKTFLACAFANRACRDGFTAKYLRAPRLLQELAVARTDGTYIKYLEKLARVDLLVLDDWGIAPLSDVDRRDLLELFDDRHGTRSTLITSQLPVESWHKYLGDPTLADAIVDRIVHIAHRLILRPKGGSMRERLKPEKEDC